MPHHILLLGGTGPTGRQFIDQAVKAGHSLTIYARNPSKLAKETLEYPVVKTIKGELGDVSKLAEAATCGATIFVSFAGPIQGHKGRATRNGFRTISWISPEDKFSLTWSLVRLLIKTMARDAYEDLVAIRDYVSSIPPDQLAWTMMRLPNLTDGEPKPVREAFRGDGKDGMSLTRANLPQWVLNEIDERKWVGKPPMLSN